MKIALYCPMRPVDAAGASGDRAIAQMIREGLASLGHEIVSGPDLVTWSPAPQPLSILKEKAEEAAKRTLLDAPDLFFTYHNYYKAPDLIGPRMAQAGVPCVIAEASHAPRRADGPWADGLEAARLASEAADALLSLTARDRPALEAMGWGPKIVDLPLYAAHAPHEAQGARHDLLTVAMMRAGAKLDSYRILARALGDVPGHWHLTIIGDGPARPDVEAAFAPLAPRVTFKGALPPAEVAAAMGEAGTFIWPGRDEGLGLVYLEAMLAGLACIALDEPGPRAALGDAGVLTDAAGLTRAISRMLTNENNWRAAQAGSLARARSRHTRDAFLAALDRGLGKAMS